MSESTPEKEPQAVDPRYVIFSQLSTAAAAMDTALQYNARMRVALDQKLINDIEYERRKILVKQEFLKAADLPEFTRLTVVEGVAK